MPFLCMFVNVVVVAKKGVYGDRHALLPVLHDIYSIRTSNTGVVSAG